MKLFTVVFIALNLMGNTVLAARVTLIATNDIVINENTNQTEIINEMIRSDSSVICAIKHDQSKQRRLIKKNSEFILETDDGTSNAKFHTVTMRDIAENLLASVYPGHYSKEKLDQVRTIEDIQSLAKEFSLEIKDPNSLFDRFIIVTTWTSIKSAKTGNKYPLVCKFMGQRESISPFIKDFEHHWRSLNISELLNLVDIALSSPFIQSPEL